MRRSLVLSAALLAAFLRLAEAQTPDDLIFNDGFDLLIPGSGCVAHEQCASGTCVDGVCCTSDCTGTCRSCNLPGSEGTCTAIPNGQDPANECGAVSCAGYYWGWQANICWERADVSAQQASCDGAGACRSTATECGASGASGRGEYFVECYQIDCLRPNFATCHGTLEGTCNYIPGCIPL